MPCDPHMELHIKTAADTLPSKPAPTSAGNVTCDTWDLTWVWPGCRTTCRRPDINHQLAAVLIHGRAGHECVDQTH